MSRLTSVLALALALALALTTAGCIENMGDLKETLGVRAPPPPAIVYEPPIAKAQVNATTALVGEIVRFTSEGSKDAQALPLDYAWTFDDGATARGPIATHAFTTPGEHKARLVVTNTAGLADDDTLVLRIVSSDRAPDAAIRVADASGVSTLRGAMGTPLAFSAEASDPEGRALSYEWDFGDGATAHDARAEHAYAAPGIYDARLSVTDAAGNVAVATARVAIDATWRESGAFAPAGADRADVPIVVAKDAKSLKLTLTFDPSMALNDLELAVLDANGELVRSTAIDALPGSASGERALEIDEFANAGAWTVQVVHERGLEVAWTLDVVEVV